MLHFTAASLLTAYLKTVCPFGMGPLLRDADYIYWSLKWTIWSYLHYSTGPAWMLFLKCYLCLRVLSIEGSCVINILWYSYSTPDQGANGKSLCIENWLCAFMLDACGLIIGRRPGLGATGSDGSVTPCARGLAPLPWPMRPGACPRTASTCWRGCAPPRTISSAAISVAV